MSARRLTTECCEQLAFKARFQLGVMANHFGVTMRQFERRFREDLGTTPTDWLRRFRCKLARERAARGVMTKAIAFELRYANASQLCHDVLRICGCSLRAADGE